MILKILNSSHTHTHFPGSKGTTKAVIPKTPNTPHTLPWQFGHIGAKIPRVSLSETILLNL